MCCVWNASSTCRTFSNNTLTCADTLKIGFRKQTKKHDSLKKDLFGFYSFKIYALSVVREVNWNWFLFYLQIEFVKWIRLAVNSN